MGENLHRTVDAGGGRTVKVCAIERVTPAGWTCGGYLFNVHYDE